MAGLTVEMMIEILKDENEIPGTFIETGTYLAETALQMCAISSQVVSIELSREFYERAVEKYGRTRVQFIHGDSKNVLGSECSIRPYPCVFFLDAHWFRRGCPHHRRKYVASGSPFPLWDELQVIKERKYNDIVIVDDVHAFGRPKKVKRDKDEGWWEVTVESILDFLGDRVNRHYVLKDVFVLHMREDE